MRICHYSETALPKLGGQELAVDATLRHQQSQGHEVMLLTQRPRRKYRIDDSQLPYPVVRHPRMLSTHRFVGFYRYWLLKAYRRFRFDVLHCHSVYPCGYLAALCRDVLKVPIVVTSHGGDIHAGNARLRKAGVIERFRLALRQSDAQVAISRFTAEGFRRLDPTVSRIEMIPNGVDLEPFASRPSRPDTLDPAIRAGEYVFFIGRLHERKGVDVLVEAMRQVCVAQPQAQLVIAGDGVERPRLVEQVERNDLSKNVIFAGPVRGETKTWLLQNARCVAVPSRQWEAFGLVVLEGFAAYRPAVVSDLPGMADLIDEGRTGFVVPVEQPAPLAQALLRWLDDAKLADSMGTAGRAVAEGYEWSHVAERLTRLYDELIVGRRANVA